jgi:hypothetical protein
MAKLKLAELMNCDQARALFADLIAERLDAERRGRVRGHLLACEECSVAFAEALDGALASGSLPHPAVPPLPIPVSLLPPEAGLSGFGEVRGGLWEAVKQWASAAAGTPLDAGRAIQGQAAEIGRSFTKARARFANLLRRLQGSYALWGLDFGVTGPVMGPGLGGNTVHVQHLDERGHSSAQGMASVEDGPKITPGGRFHLVVHSDDARWSGRRMICSLQLVEGDAVRFECDAQPTLVEKRWRADFVAEGLPAVDKDVAVPLEFVSLYSAPRRREP